MADENVTDDLPRGFLRAVITVALPIAAVAIVAAVMIERPLQLAEFLFPYPLIALVAAPLMAWVAARLRRAPARSRTELLVPWSCVVARFALLAAATGLMVAWIVAELIGGPVAVTLLEAFILATMARVIFIIAEQCAIDVGRAIRGPVSAGT